MNIQAKKQPTALDSARTTTKVITDSIKPQQTGAKLVVRALWRDDFRVLCRLRGCSRFLWG